MLVVLGGHLVDIGDGYWWFKLNLLIFILKCCYFLSLKGAFIYFWATEYVFWSFFYTVWMRHELLLLYDYVGPSKKEIIVKRSNFQKKIWTDLQKKIRITITKQLISGIVHGRACLKFLLVTKDPLGSSGKNLCPSPPPRSFLKSILFHALAFF